MSRLLQRLRTRFESWLGSPPRRGVGAAIAAGGETAQSANPAQGRRAPLACASVVIPALNEAARIAAVVRYALADPATAEVIVVDDSSIDDTAELARAAGARVITSTMLGKGTSMQDGVAAAACELLVFLDGDLSGLREGIVSDLCRPLLAGDADFVKARFGRGGGRVTELTAKPMLKVFFPELAGFAQPLGGIIAGRRELLRSLGFEEGYGVDIGLLIDAHRAGAKLAEVDIGSLEHDSQPLHDLTAMVNEVSRVIYARARAAGRLHVEQITAMYETQRHVTASFDYILTRRRGRTRVALLDMDGTLTTGRFALELARATDREDTLLALLDGGAAVAQGLSVDAATRSQGIAGVFRFVHRQLFERVAHGAEIRPGAIEFVNRLKRAGFMVGIVSDSYFIAAEIVRRRVFADFALAHTLQFDSDVCSGELRLNPAFMPMDGDAGNAGDALCKSHVIRRFRADPVAPLVQEVWALGDNLNDRAMLQLADRGFVIDPKSPSLAQLPGVPVVASFDELAALVPLPQPLARAA